LRRKLYSARYSKRRAVSRSPPPDRSGFYANNNPGMNHFSGFSGSNFGGGGQQYDDDYGQNQRTFSRSRSKSPSKRRKKSGRH
jgi:hypothetical protein